MNIMRVLNLNYIIMPSDTVKERKKNLKRKTKVIRRK